MFALVVAPVDDLGDADVTEYAGDAEDIEDVLAGLLDETLAAAAVRADAAPDEHAATRVSVGGKDADAAAESSDTDPDDDAEGEYVGGDGQPGEVVAWGLSFPERAVIFMHNPLTGQDYFGIFESPERARRFYSAFGELHLIYV